MSGVWYSGGGQGEASGEDGFAAEADKQLVHKPKEAKLA